MISVVPGWHPAIRSHTKIGGATMTAETETTPPVTNPVEAGPETRESESVASAPVAEKAGKPVLADAGPSASQAVERKAAKPAATRKSAKPRKKPAARTVKGAAKTTQRGKAEAAPKREQKTKESNTMFEENLKQIQG
ncbi:MAG: hypothetical protein D6763_11295, partial [Alphaproteobacteria bacterium]